MSFTDRSKELKQPHAARALTPSEPISQYPDEYKKQLFEEFLRRGGLPALDEIEA